MATRNEEWRTHPGERDKLVGELRAFAAELILHGEKGIILGAVAEIERLRRLSDDTEDIRNYAVVLCLDGTEPIDVVEAMIWIDHIGPDGQACSTPADDFGHASRWRHPTTAELLAYHNDLSAM